MNQQKVLIVANSHYITGAFKSILYNCVDLQGEKDFVFIIPEGSTIGSRLENHHIKFYELPMREINRSAVNNLAYPISLLRNAYKLSKIIKMEKVEVVHGNDLFNLVGVIVKIFTKIKVVTHVRRLENSFPKILFMGWVFFHKHFSDKIICVSKVCASPFSESNRISIIYDRLPNKEKYPRYSPAQNQDVVKMLYLANYNNGKGQNLALEAIDKLVKKGIENFRISFVGGHFNNAQNKEFKKRLGNLVKDNHLGSFVEIKEEVSDVEGLMKQYDVILNFSESESFSMVCAEALYFGIPLISSACGGPSELIEHNKTGVLVENRNVDEMEKAMARLINSSDLRKGFSENSYRLIRKKFDRINPSKELLSVYIEMARK